MPTPDEIMASAAALMNNTERDVYTNEAVLPYFNLAVQELQELFELHNIPVTNSVSAAITVPAGTSVISKTGPVRYPGNLVEIQQLWERPEGNDPWIPMSRKEFLPHYLEGAEISQFLVWSWIKEEIHVLPATQDNDLKIDYVSRMVTLPITIEQVNIDLPFSNVKTYLDFKTASLCAMFIGENQSRAQILESEAALAMDRALGIKVKAAQAINTRRRPFRSSYKRRGWW